MNNNIFDTSSIQIKPISDSDFKLELEDKVSDILKTAFKNEPIKQNVHRESAGYNFACPFCGDSATDPKKKRGHIILKGKWSGHYKCFNCGKFMKIPEFFKAFKTPLTLSALTYAHNQTNYIYNYSVNTDEVTSDILNKENILKYTVPLDVFSEKLGLIKINKNERICYPAHLYLLSRCQYNYDNFLYDPAGRYIVILNLINDNVLGCQIRDITGKKDIRYKTLTLSSIHKNILKDDVEVPENIDSLSTIFNIFNVNIYKPVLVTEGPFDAFLLPNCIATSGANKTIPINLPFYYVYDSDKTGNEHALEKLKEGYNVFMWSKLKQDLKLPEHNPYSNNKFKWDINDVIIWCRDNNYKQQIYWSKYFSNDKLDGLDI